MGNAYIADDFNNCVRKVSTTGIITTFARTGTSGNSGTGGPAIAAEMSAPVAVAVDNSDNVYIVEQGNSNVRKVNSLGIISLVAGNGSDGYSGDGWLANVAGLNKANRIAISGSGDVYITDCLNYRVRKIDGSGIITTFAGTGTAAHSGDGGQATDAPMQPYGVACDAKGNIYIGDYDNIRIVAPSGIINTVVGNGTNGYNGDCLEATTA